ERRPRGPRTARRGHRPGLRAALRRRLPDRLDHPHRRSARGAEDEAGYENTSAFHCRFVDGTRRWSEHAFGAAIDINVHLNPYRRGSYLWPEGSGRYLDRTLGAPGMIVEGDAVVAAFDDIGWGWGGRWGSSKDYQHFSASGR